jgi:hypothetical protein
VTVATPAPIHIGTICQGGTTCQATLTDRRLGDYFSVDIDGTGRMYVGYSDTQVNAGVSLPAFVRQRSGPAMLVPRGTAGSSPSATTGRPATPVSAAVLPRGRALAATGLATWLPGLGAFVLLLVLLSRVRARRS